MTIDSNRPRIQGMQIAWVYLFFSMHTEDKSYPCALVQWFWLMDNKPDHLTGMWTVIPECLNEEPHLSIISIHSIVRAAHLIPVYGQDFVANPHQLNQHQTLDKFNLFYVNKYVDHHAFKTVY